jgi:hypothetical protein
MSLLLLVATLTLGGSPLAEGEVLQVVVPGAVREDARSDAPILGTLALGAKVEALALNERTHGAWIELRGGGFVEASRLDREPESFEGDLPPGGEGLGAGRVLPWSYAPSDLVDVPMDLRASGYEWRRMRLRADALAAFERLAAAARIQECKLSILSAFRDGDYQQGLYARAVQRNPAQNHTAPPGRSEHQLGTTVDVAVPGIPTLSVELERSPCYAWLAAHAAEFGFVISYSRERHEASGVAFEPWHLRWVAEMSADSSGW